MAGWSKQSWGGYFCNDASIANLAMSSIIYADLHVYANTAELSSRVHKINSRLCLSYVNAISAFTSFSVCARAFICHSRLPNAGPIYHGSLIGDICIHVKMCLSHALTLFRKTSRPPTVLTPRNKSRRAGTDCCGFNWFNYIALIRAGCFGPILYSTGLIPGTVIYV